MEMGWRPNSMPPADDGAVGADAATFPTGIAVAVANGGAVAADSMF